MKVLQYLILASIILILSCSKNKENLSQGSLGLLRLEFFDSVLVKEDPIFIGQTSHHELINDTTLVISSYKTPGVWAINPKNGTIRSGINSEEFFEFYFFPSGLNLIDYPEIKILDPKQKTIFFFDLENKKFLRKIRLQIPENLSLRTIESVFLTQEGLYFIDLYPKFDNQTSLQFYHEDRDIIGVFNSNGELISTRIKFPKTYKELINPIMPFKTQIGIQSGIQPLIIFSMGENVINLITDNRSDLSFGISLPHKSKFFEFEMPKLSRPFKPEIEKYLDFPSSHFFDKAIENKKYMIIQSEMRDNSKIGKYEAKSHLFVYPKDSTSWFETDLNYDVNQIGILSGIEMDTLYFFNGMLKYSNEKFIKRAVLRPIED